MKLFFIPNAVIKGSCEPAICAQRFAQYLGSYFTPLEFFAERRSVSGNRSVCRISRTVYEGPRKQNGEIHAGEEKVGDVERVGPRYND